MSQETVSRLVWRISLPIVLVEAAETFDHLIDTAFLSRVGVAEVGAIAVADAIMLIALVLPLGLVDGIQILTAQRAGERRPASAGAIFNQGLLMIVLAGAALTIALKLLSPFAAARFVESPEVGRLLNDYLQIDAYSIVLTGATFAFGALLTSLGRTGALIPATAVFVVSDIALNDMFIFGKAGAPALGMRGAAVASVGAELLTLIFLAAYTWRALDRERYGLFRLRGFESGAARILGALSAPIAAQGLVRELRWLGFFVIIERAGTEALAVANLVYTCHTIFLIPTEGFAETCCSLVGRLIGRNRSARLPDVLKSSVGGALIATGPFLLFAVLAPGVLLAAFAPDASLLVQSVAGLRIVAAAMLVAIPAEIALAAVLGTGDTSASLAIESVALIVMLVGTYLSVVQFSLPLDCVWLALPAAWFTCLALSYGWMQAGAWRRLEL